MSDKTYIYLSASDPKSGNYIILDNEQEMMDFVRKEFGIPNVQYNYDDLGKMSADSCTLVRPQPAENIEIWVMVTPTHEPNQHVPAMIGYIIVVEGKIY